MGISTTEKDRSYTAEGIRDFDPVHIFECGQCFRWERREDGSYDGAAKGRIVNVRYEAGRPDSGSGKCSTAGRLTLTPCTETEFREIWYDYFDLGRDYSSIKECLSENDEIMRKAIEYGGGIRILRQDLWETIVSFIISQNNNIPRIKGCIERFCNNFGEPITKGTACAADSGLACAADSGTAGAGSIDAVLEGSAEKRCSIPSPEKLASLTVDDLAPVRLGYRAKYLIETAKTVCEKGLPEDFDQLSELCGVGPKVASCISLFGMQDYASFPIDVWVMKVMHELYGLPEKDKKAMAAFAKEKFGDLGGFAQQYLFYYMRDRA